jgi:hypothetical protein
MVWILDGILNIADYYFPDVLFAILDEITK